jgi:hypothetical protein
MSELLFEVVQEADGGYCADCLTESIFADGETWEQKRRATSHRTTPNRPCTTWRYRRRNAHNPSDHVTDRVVAGRHFAALLLLLHDRLREAGKWQEI